MAKMEWMKFWPKHWRNDIELRSCSLAARGLWIEMIAIMHQAEPYGHLLIAGRSVTEAQLAGLVGASTEEIGALLMELQAVGVFSRTRTGVIYSRKMTRDAKAARNARENGKKGGNPTLCNTRDNPPPDNPWDSRTHKPKKREERREKKDLPPPPESLTSARAPDSGPPHAEQPAAKPVSSPGGGDGGGSATPCSEDDQTIAEEIGAILGSNAPAWAWAGIHVRRWREAGASPALIRAVAKGVRAAIDASGREPPGDARYLDKPIDRALSEAKRPLARGADSRPPGANPADALIAQSARYRRTA